MKKAFIIIILLTITLYCFSQNNDTLIFEKYRGCWVNSCSEGFIIIDMKDLKHIALYHYFYDADNEENTMIFSKKHWFYKSSGFVKSFHDQGLSIQTKDYRYDLILKNDTLFLWNERGIISPMIKYIQDE